MPDPSQDPDFLKAPVAEQHQYLLSTDKDYAKATPHEQVDYLTSLQKPTQIEQQGKLPDTTSGAGPLARTAYGIGRGLNNLVEGVYQPLVHPLDTVNSMVASTEQHLANAKREPSTLGKIAEYGAAIPGLGPMGQQLGQRAAGGDIAGAISEGLTTAAGPSVLKSGLQAVTPSSDTLARAFRTEEGQGKLKPLTHAGSRVLGGVAGGGIGAATGIPYAGYGGLALGGAVGPEVAESVIPRIEPSGIGAPLPNASDFYEQRGADLMKRVGDVEAEGQQGGGIGASLPSAPTTDELLTRAIKEGRAAKIPTRIPRSSSLGAESGLNPSGNPSLTGGGILHVPEKSGPFPNDPEGNAQNIPRNLLPRIAARTGDPAAAAEYSRVTGKPHIVIPKEAGYPGPRANTLEVLEGTSQKASTPIDGGVVSPSGVTLNPDRTTPVQVERRAATGSSPTGTERRATVFNSAPPDPIRQARIQDMRTILKEPSLDPMVRATVESQLNDYMNNPGERNALSPKEWDKVRAQNKAPMSLEDATAQTEARKAGRNQRFEEPGPGAQSLGDKIVDRLKKPFVKDPEAGVFKIGGEKATPKETEPFQDELNKIPESHLEGLKVKFENEGGARYYRSTIHIDKDNPEMMTHEIGHHVHYNLSDADKNRWNTISSKEEPFPGESDDLDYGPKNSEHFAEAYQRYADGGDVRNELKRYPESYKFMQKLWRNQRFEEPGPGAQSLGDKIVDRLKKPFVKDPEAGVFKFGHGKGTDEPYNLKFKTGKPAEFNAYHSGLDLDDEDTVVRTGSAGTFFHGDKGGNEYGDDVAPVRVKFDNPLVLESQKDALDKLFSSEERAKLDPVVEEIKRTGNDKTAWSKLDTAITNAARAKGHDGIIYKGTKLTPHEYIAIDDASINRDNRSKPEVFNTFPGEKESPEVQVNKFGGKHATPEDLNGNAWMAPSGEIHHVGAKYSGLDSHIQVNKNDQEINVRVKSSPTMKQLQAVKKMQENSGLPITYSIGKSQGTSSTFQDFRSRIAKEFVNK